MSDTTAAGGVELRGALGFGESATATFARHIEFHGYTFDARAGATITAEVTQRGSSRAAGSSFPCPTCR